MGEWVGAEAPFCSKAPHRPVPYAATAREGAT